MADSNSCALVIRLRKEKRVVALPKVKFLDKNLSFQEVFTDVYDGDLHVRVKCRVGFKKPGDAEPKDFVSVDLTENVGAIVNALSANFVDFDVLDEEPQAKAVKPLNAFDVLMKAASTEILPPELHNRPLQLAKILYYYFSCFFYHVAFNCHIHKNGAQCCGCLKDLICFDSYLEFKCCVLYIFM